MNILVHTAGPWLQDIYDEVVGARRKLMNITECGTCKELLGLNVEGIKFTTQKQTNGLKLTMEW